MSVSSWLNTCHLTKFKHLDFPNSFFPAEVLAAGTENAENSPGQLFLYYKWLLASDQGCISLLDLLDHSAAFDTIDNDILIDLLQNYMG